jgi:HK97 family phage portal protein
VKLIPEWMKFKPKNYDSSVFQKWLTGLDFTGQGSSTVSSETALKYNTFFACLRILGETFSTVPIFEYKRLANGDREKTNATGMLDMLHYQFNEEMSAFMGKEASMYSLNLGGNSVAVRGKNRLGQTIELTPHPWENVTISRNKETNKLEYKIKTFNGEKTYQRSDVLHVAGPSTNGIIGMSPLTYAASSINLGLAYEKFGNTFYKNGVMSSGVFWKEGSLTDEARERLKEGLLKSYQGLINAGKPMVLEDGLQYKQLQMNLADAELLASKNFQVVDICRIFRIPPHLVQDLSRSTNNNIEHQSLEFVMYTMLPWFKRWEDAINTQLLTRQQRDAGYYFEFNVNALLRGDQKSMADAFAVGRQWGWLSVNDIRRLLNMNSIPNGDIYLEPLNMTEAGAQEVDPKLAKEVSNLVKGYYDAKK